MQKIYPTLYIPVCWPYRVYGGKNIIDITEI